MREPRANSSENLLSLAVPRSPSSAAPPLLALTFDLASTARIRLPSCAQLIAVTFPCAITARLGIVIRLAAQMTPQQLLSSIRFARVFVRRAPGILQTPNPRLPRVAGHALRVAHFCITHAPVAGL